MRPTTRAARRNDRNAEAASTATKMLTHVLRRDEEREKKSELATVDAADRGYDERERYCAE